MIKFSVLILAKNEEQNLRLILPQISESMAGYTDSFEIVVVDGASHDQTVEVSQSLGARVVRQTGAGYGDAFRLGLESCSGERIIAVDADNSHRAEVIPLLIESNDDSDLVIASRFITGGRADMPFMRRLLSRTLSLTVRLVANVGVSDCSSGFRVYKRKSLEGLVTHGQQFDVLVELLVLMARRGCVIREKPFHYRDRAFGRSHVQVLKFGLSYTKTLLRLVRLEPAPRK